MKRLFCACVAVLGLVSGPAIAGSCDPGKGPRALSDAEVAAVYDCIAAELHAGYQSGPKHWIPAKFVADYRDWGLASAFPARPGFHAERFLITYVNEIGFDAYVKYATAPEIPAGTVIAKVSFSVTDEGRVRPGPLFLMQKVAAGRSPASNDWFYMMVAPDGRPQAVEVMSACVSCHQDAYGYQGGLGYPVPEARLGN